MGEIDVNGTGKLGFGLMRLPRKGLSIDIEQTSRMVDLFMEAGMTYFDTAFIYPGSEAATKLALVDRYPRESYTLATKLFASMVPTEKMAKGELETSLKRTGAGYFDYYLLHALQANNYRKYEKYHLWDFVKEEKAGGRIKHFGFSFHDSPELLDEILTDHPEAEFVQLQINYADWENPGIQSRGVYEVARKHGKPVIIMEPVKGGTLAKPIKEVQNLFDEANPNASYASWAIRFAASLDGILTVLSGMSNIAQMEDNLSYMKDFCPLNDDEMKVIQKAETIYGASKAIPCTACRYCTTECPKHIDIPAVLAAVNKRQTSGQIEAAAADYATSAQNGGKASDCIKCRRCENTCPQHITITEELEKAAELFEK
jgi:predicted aldo/keto reductase-like oxidoreductase